MKLNLVLSSVEDLQEFRKNLLILRLQFLSFQSILIRKLANIIILESIQEKMRSAGFSEKIVTNTIVGNIEILSISRIQIHILSEYFTDTGFDVAVAREDGTKRHFIKPVRKKALKYIIDGEARFSKGHFVDGIVAYKIIKTTIKEKKESLQDEYNRQLSNWVEKNMRGVSIAN